MDVSRLDLTGYDLRSLTFPEADFSGCDLAHADLRDADLSAAKSINTSALRGADLRAALLPPSLAFDFQSTSDLLRNCRALFITMLVSAAYVMLAAASTKDVDLLTASKQFALPVVNTEISLFGFYSLGPVALMLFALFFYLNIERLFDRLARYPATFPSGALIDEAVAPWVTTELIRVRQPRLRTEVDSVWFVRMLFGSILTWFSAPSAIAVIWLRYLKRHDAFLTTIHVVLLLIAVTMAMWFLYVTLVGRKRSYRVMVLVLSLSLVGVALPAGYVSYVVLEGRVSPGALLTVLGHLGYKPNLNLSGAIVSARPQNWSPGLDREYLEVTGANLAHASLRDAVGKHVFLARADLTQADLRRAVLPRARLQYAELTGANGTEAVFDQADFHGAHFHGADFSKIQASGAKFEDAVMKNVVLNGAILTGAVFRGADLDDAKLVGAYLVEARINNTKLRRADLSFANLYEAIVSADLTNAKLDKASLAGADLSHAVGLVQEQIDRACSDDRTRLPQGLVPRSEC